MLDGTPPLEITLHRIVWGAVFAALFTSMRGRMVEILRIFRDRKTLIALAVSKAC